MPLASRTRLESSGKPSLVSRRDLLARTAHGLGIAALGSLMELEGLAASTVTSDPGAPRPAPASAPRAKSVIFLFMAGGPSHLDLLDPKPKMASLHGTPMPASLGPVKKSATGGVLETVMASRRRFRPYGGSGIEFSELLSHTGELADELCVVRSMHCEQANHDPAQLLLNCGSPLFGNPSVGSWATYGLGSAAKNLPGYVVLLSNSGKGIDAGSALWSSGFMPAMYRGVTLRNSPEPLLYAANPPGLDRASQRARLDALQDLNRLRLQQTGDGEIESRIASYELAFRMQSAAPELLDLRGETASTRALYGLDDEVTRPFGTNCLLARRMVERGVRFVQLFHSTWDDHSELDKNIQINCDMIDRPTAGLLVDLKQRGLLDETLVVWAGEFGRTPMGEVRRGSAAGKEGRDHHPQAFSLWMAGGGVRGGHVHGRTDDFGFHVVEKPVHVHDFQATLLYLLGIDHERLTYRHSGRDFRLTDVHGEVVRELLA